MNRLRTPVCASLVAQTGPVGPRLALARSAVMEAINDNPRTVDWTGVAFALADASVKDLEEECRT